MFQTIPARNNRPPLGSFMCQYEENRTKQNEWLHFPSSHALHLVVLNCTLKTCFQRSTLFSSRPQRWKIRTVPFSLSIMRDFSGAVYSSMTPPNIYYWLFYSVSETHISWYITVCSHTCQYYKQLIKNKKKKITKYYICKFLDPQGQTPKTNTRPSCTQLNRVSESNKTICKTLCVEIKKSIIRI